MWCHVLICALLPLSGQKNGPFDAVYRAGEPQTVRVRTVITVRENTRANAALRVVAPSGETIRYERIDFMHALNGAEPWRDRSLVRAAGAVTNEFTLVLESAGDYALKLSRAAGSWKSWKTPLDPVGVWVEKVGPLAVPDGFVSARVHPLHASLNSGVADRKAQFKATVHQCHPIYCATAELVNLGYTFEQHIFSNTNEMFAFGMPGARYLRADPPKSLMAKYPYPKKGETFVPVGRKMRADGRFWNAWSHSFAEANEAAYGEDLETVRRTLADPVADAITESWSLAWESGGSYDYSEASVAAFRRYLEERYGSIGELNRAWRTDYTAFSEIVPVDRELCRGPKALTNGFELARARANFIDFRDFCSKEYAKVIARRAKAALTDPKRRPVSMQFANLMLNAVEWPVPLNLEDAMRISLKDTDCFGYDVYGADDWVGAEFDQMSAFGRDAKPLQVREGSTHTPDPDLAVRTYWTLVGKGLKGFSNFMLQEGNNHPEFPKFGLTNFDQSPRPKLAAYADAVRAIRQVEDVLVPAWRTRAVKPVAIYYNRDCNALQDRSYGSLFDCAPDSFFRVYELLRANGYPVTFLTDTLIREKEPLEEVAALLFIDAKYVPDDVLDVVTAWVERGGHVLADAQPGLYDEHGFPSDRFVSLLGIAPVREKKVDALVAEKNQFGYSAQSFDVVDADRLHRTQFEFFQQWDSTHPMNRALGKFMFSGFGYQKVDCTNGTVVAMAHNGKSGFSVNPRGKGTFSYFAGYLGTVFGGGATQYEWRDAHSEDSPYRFMDAYCAFVGAERETRVVSGLPPVRARRLRLESPLVDARGNAILSLANYTFEPTGAIGVEWRLPATVKRPRLALALRAGTRELTQLSPSFDDGCVAFEVPSFGPFAAVLLLADAPSPLVSLRTEGGTRGAAGLVELHPGDELRVAVRVFNGMSRDLGRGRVTLRLPRGWFYDRETAEISAVRSGAAADEVVFRVRGPSGCSRTDAKPINFIYESDDGVKSMPTAELVWWKNKE